MLIVKTFFWIIMIIMIFIGSIFIIYLNNDLGISFVITIPIFIFLWTALLIVLAKFFNYKWKVMEFETKRNIESFFKEKEDKGEKRINRIK